MKVSQITINDVKKYLVLEDEDLDERDSNLLQIFLDASKAYLKSYTGLDAKELDKREDLSYVILIVVAEMFENREFQTKDTDLNKLVEHMIEMHSVNLVG